MSRRSLLQAPLLDIRDAAALREQIRLLSENYTPAWRFHPEDPDVGSVLAILFSEMFSESIERFNGVLENNFLHFLNALGGQLLPALPAQGYVRFQLSPNAPESALVPRQEPVVAPGEEGIIPFETKQDVMVIPARLLDIYSISPRRDRITKLYDAMEPMQFKAFDTEGENLQYRAFSFSHDSALWLKNAQLELRLDTPLKDPQTAEAIDALGDCIFEVLTGEGERVELSPSRTQNGYLLQFDLESAVPRISYQGQAGRWMRVRPRQHNEAVEKLALSSLRLCAKGEARPDAIYVNDEEQNLDQCFAFGSTFSIFDDLLVSCDEAMCKPGAAVDMKFLLSYERVRIETFLDQQEIDWKLVMRREDFRPEAEYDITIPKVAWEYWNGFGWARLFADERYDAFFDAGIAEEEREATLRFVVPQDIHPTTWGARQGYFIRARIRRINNSLRPKGWYVSPMIENMRFAYAYEEPGVFPQYIAREGHMVAQCRPYTHWIQGDQPMMPYAPWPHEQPAMYLRFSAPLVGAPLRMLIDLGAGSGDALPPLRWEYHAREGGRNRWLPLNAMDGTDSLKKTDMLTFVGEANSTPDRLFGQDGWWLRLIGLDNAYDAIPSSRLPRIGGVYMNASAVEQRQTQATEYFTLGAVEPGLVIELSEGNLLSCTVEMESLKALSRGEMQALSDQERLELIRSADGTPQEAWVRWEAVEDLLLSGEEDRHYQLDPIGGTLLFCLEKHGRTPHVGAKLRVRYTTGGGKAGNLPAGAIQRMTRQIGFVQRVENPMPTFGGCEQETIEDAARRLVAHLRHGGRAVSKADYEDLAMQASRAILRAECYCDRDEKGLYSPGHVTLVFLQKDYLEGLAFQRQIADQLERYIAGRAPGDLVAAGRLHVQGPQFVSICCRIEAVADTFDDVYAVQQDIQGRLAAYLDPVSGNFDGGGWEIGSLPNTTQIYNAIKPVAHISRIRRVTMTAYAEDAQGHREIDLEHIESTPYCLPINGAHDLRIVVR